MPRFEFNPSESAIRDELGAGVSFEMHEQYLSANDADRVFNDEASCYLMGRGCYRTVFSEPTDHDEEFTFCFSIEFRGGPRSLDGDQIRSNIRLMSRSEYEIVTRADTERPDQ